MTKSPDLEASCECGALRVTMRAQPVVQLVCHCADCQSFFERPYVQAAFFRGSECTIHGEAVSTTLMGGTGLDKTHFACSRCNTPLFVFVSALNEACAVSAERIASFSFEPVAHIWTSQKSDEAVIPDDVAQSDEGPSVSLRDQMIADFWGEL